jgi:hypothetical protein
VVKVMIYSAGVCVFIRLNRGTKTTNTGRKRNYAPYNHSYDKTPISYDHMRLAWMWVTAVWISRYLVLFHKG